jgi:hypothetical protein
MKMIQQQKRIEIIERARADAPLQAHTGALDHVLRLNDLQNSPSSHYCLLPLASVQRLRYNLHIEGRSD